MLLSYRQNPSFFAVGQRVGVLHQTVQRCIERAVAYRRWRHLCNTHVSPRSTGQVFKNHGQGGNQAAQCAQLSTTSRHPEFKWKMAEVLLCLPRGTSTARFFSDGPISRKCSSVALRSSRIKHAITRESIFPALEKQLADIAIAGVAATF